MLPELLKRIERLERALERHNSAGGVNTIPGLDLPVYANNVAALAGGLVAGQFYQDGGAGEWSFLTAPLTSASWNGDSYSTTAKTLIDLSAVFGAPAGVRAILARTLIRDSGSAARQNTYLILSNEAGAAYGPYWNRADGQVNDYWCEKTAVCPCDANGDIYVEINASGVTTMDIWIEIWGYLGGG